ncbi:MAG: stage II sporulation protein D [Sporomusaceae bacterium]|nr:stage II sporulation protein D [Sporomusaceae bacterium]
MKTALKILIGGLIVLLLLPALIVYGPRVKMPFSMPFGSYNEHITVRLYQAEVQKIIDLDLEDYVAGVVAAEMPAEFESEALAAQAVAARTYAVRTLKIFGGKGAPDHPGADISSDYREGQAWISEAERKKRWQGQYEAKNSKIKAAVAKTAGMILTYEGEPIHAVFHSTAGPKTASSREVWGSDYPYLVSVTNNWDRQSPRYQEDKEYTLRQLQDCLGVNKGSIAAFGQSAAKPTDVHILSLTESGRVDKVRFGDKVLTGQEVREKLGLRSTNFTVTVTKDSYIFHTTGYGHGVGLSQYGADGMAKAGYDYKQILLFYYPKTLLSALQGG